MDPKTIRWGCLAGGLALGTAFMAADAVLTAMSPWVVGFMWLSVFFMVGYGIGAIGLARLPRTLLTLMLAIVAYAFWQATTPHADIAVGVVLLNAKQREPDEVAMNVYYGNIGNDTARYMHVSRQVFVPSKVDDVTRHKMEDYSFAELNKHMATAPGYLENELISGAPRSRFAPVYLRALEGQLPAFRNGDLMLLIVGQFRYRDWWFRTQITDYCMFLRVNAAPLSCSRYNGKR